MGSWAHRFGSSCSTEPRRGRTIWAGFSHSSSPALAQAANFFVQMSWVSDSDASLGDTAWEYAPRAVLIVVVNLMLPSYVT